MVNFSYPPGILNGQPGAQPQLNMGQPVLSQNVQAKAPALTGNARMSSRMPMIPDNRIGLGEGMLRVGGAMMQGAETGQGYSSAIDAYGNIMDYNRAREMEQYQYEQEQKLAEQRRQDLLRKMNATQAKADKGGDAESAAKALVALQNAQDVLDGFDRRDNVVGWGSFFVRGWDKLTGDERENLRLKIETMKVDRVLANIAQTKGAISEKEMDIFMSDQPSWMDGEEIWRKWITDYMAAIRVMHTNLANGTTTENGASINTMSDSGDYKILSVEDPNT